MFAGATGIISQDNANFFWDDTTKSLGVGINTPDAQGHFYKLFSTPLTPWNAAANLAGQSGSSYTSGQTIFYRVYSKASSGPTYYSSTYNEYNVFINSDGDAPYIEFGSGDGIPHIELSLDGGSSYTYYIDGGSSFYDYGPTIWFSPVVHTPTDVSSSSRINYSDGSNVFGFHTDSNFYLGGKVLSNFRVGAQSPDDTSAPFSVVGTAANTEQRLGFFENNKNTSRGEFTIANSGDGSWTYNFMSIMNHGSAYAANYYTDHDAGSSIFLLQGAQAYQMAFATYNTQPINFWVGAGKKVMDLHEGTSIAAVKVYGSGDGGDGSLGILEGYGNSSTYKLFSLSADSSGQSYGAFYMYGDSGLAGGRVFEFFGMDRSIGGDQRVVGLYGQNGGGPTGGAWTMGIYVAGQNFNADDTGYFNAPGGFAVSGATGFSGSGAYTNFTINGGIITAAS